MWFMWGIGFLILFILALVVIDPMETFTNGNGKIILDDDQLDYFKQETRENFKEFRNFLNLIERALG